MASMENSGRLILFITPLFALRHYSLSMLDGSDHKHDVSECIMEQLKLDDSSRMSKGCCS